MWLLLQNEMSDAVVELSCTMRWQRYMDWLFISMLQGPAGSTVDNSGIGVVWQCSNLST